MGVIDLNTWHHGIHQVTGNMATRFNRATPADLEKWAKALRKIAGEMEERAVGEVVPEIEPDFGARTAPSRNRRGGDGAVLGSGEVRS